MSEENAPQKERFLREVEQQLLRKELDARLMGNRKLPFGYQMRMGEIVRNEPEAKAVQDIFLQYTLGASLKEIAEQMSKTGPSYDEGKSWNKNMIARILENAKYTGIDSYPKLVDIKLFEAAAEIWNTKFSLITSRTSPETGISLEIKDGFPMFTLNSVARLFRHST